MSASSINMALTRQKFLVTVFSALAVISAIMLPAQAAAADLTLSDSLGNAPPADTRAAALPADLPNTVEPVISLGIGDTVTIDVYGKPDLRTTTYIADDGTALIPLAGAVKIAGLSPSEASSRIAKALRDGEFLVNPQISLSLVTSRSQLVSVLGEVGREGRYTIESNGTVFDVLAQAGGRTKDGATVIYVLRTDANGTIQRTPINLAALADPSIEFPTIKLRGGDTLYVPKAGKFFVQGEVLSPNQYVLSTGMTVTEAIAVAGGITRRGSSSRVEIKRHRPDGSYETIHPKLTDKVFADDVIRIKESIF